MPKPQFFVTPGRMEALTSKHHMMQAVRVGSQVEISGETGFSEDGVMPEAVEDEIAAAFNNVERTLNLAGASWSDVYSIVSYHVPGAGDGDGGLGQHVPAMVANMKLHMPNHQPIWTVLGVARLGEPEMRVEITVLAHVEE